MKHPFQNQYWTITRSGKADKMSCAATKNSRRCWRTVNRRWYRRSGVWDISFHFIQHKSNYIYTGKILQGRCAPVPQRAAAPQLLVGWFKMVVWVLQTTVLEIKIELAETSKPCLILYYSEIAAEYSFSINWLGEYWLWDLSMVYTHSHTHTTD